MTPATTIDVTHLSASPTFAEFALIVHQLVGLPVAIYDPAGTHRSAVYPMTPLSPLCELIHATPEGSARCAACNRQHFARAIAARRGVCYRCHAGLIDIAIPIYHQGAPLAVISSGQLLATPPSRAGWSAIADAVRGLPLLAAQLRAAYRHAPYLPEDKLTAAIRLMSFFAEHLCEVGQRLLNAEEGQAEDAMERAQRYIRDHAHLPLTVAAIAEYVCLSPCYLMDRFRKTTGMTINAYLQQQRLARVKALLLSTTLPITDIALDCGFNSISQFHRVFKRFEGCIPSAYRRRNVG